MIRAVVFDMDGLLVDSEPLWVRAEIAVFGEVGVTLSEDDCLRTKGLRSDDVVAFWHALSPWESPALHEVQSRLCTRVADLVRAEGRALPGVAHAIAIARENGRKIALASSSPSIVIRATLERLGLEDTFAIVQSAETEPLGKPHPGIFLTTAARLGIAPTECLVLEDSLTGVIAAKAARMTCIAVPCDYPKHDPRFVIADAVVGSLADLTSQMVAADGRR
jgi:HAD superfamily hydrolase (TIGR01509 family)